MRPLLLCLGLLLATPALAFDIANMTDEERAILREEIRAYLIENPEVLMDAASALEARQSAAMAKADEELVAANAGELFNDDWSFVGGNPEGGLTVVEFIDYRCGYCRKSHPEVRELVRSDGDIRYVIKEFPILGEQSLLASRFALSVLRNEGPDAYAKVNAGFYDGSFRGEIAETTLKAWAGDLGLDAGKVMAGMADPEVQRIIDDNHRLAQKLQIGGTPTFVVGGAMIRGYVPLEQMRAIAADERKG
ncbi:MAG: DsbA family protein [Paracoccaceae bacterium]